MKEHPMRFHWFWSRVTMFLGVISGLGTAATAYAMRPELQGSVQWTAYVDMAFGLAGAVLCLFVLLRRDKRDRTTWYLLLSPIALRIVYQFVVVAIYDYRGLETTVAWGQLLIAAVAGACILVYYQKRRYLFQAPLSNGIFEPTSESEPNPAPAPSSPPPEPEPAPDPAPAVESASEVFPNAENSPKYCDNCGSECERWVKFCPVCGCKTFSIWEKKPLQVVNDPALLKEADKKTRKYLWKKRLPLLALSALCMALVVLSCALLIRLKGLQTVSDKPDPVPDDPPPVVEKNDTNTASYRGLKEQYNTLETQYDNLIEMWKDALQYKYFLVDEIGFIVDGSSTYHTYDCPVFQDADEFQAHNVDYCEYQGYSPHSCWEE